MNLFVTPHHLVSTLVSTPVLISALFFSIFVAFASFRTLLHPTENLFADDGSGGPLSPWAWLYGVGCGFLRLNPGSAGALSMWAVSLSFWAKHRDLAKHVIPHATNSAETIDNDNDLFFEELPPFKKPFTLPHHHAKVRASSSSNSDRSNTPLSSAKVKFQALAVDFYKAHLFQCYHSLPLVVVAYSFAITALILVNGLFCSAVPSWVFHPAALFFFPFHTLPDVKTSLSNFCPNDPTSPTLCLTESEWHLASNGQLSPSNPKDLAAVVKGIAYASGNGLLVNILARDTAPAVQDLRDNVELLVPYFARVAVVVFENDSIDGTRGLFKDWAAEQVEAGDYTVDLMTCEGLGGDDECRLKDVHRYDESGLFASSIGRMAAYRNFLNDYIVSKYPVAGFSHVSFFQGWVVV